MQEYQNDGVTENFVKLISLCYPTVRALNLLKKVDNGAPLSLSLSVGGRGS
jgi:hypothetical protein